MQECQKPSPSSMTESTRKEFFVRRSLRSEIPFLSYLLEVYEPESMSYLITVMFPLVLSPGSYSYLLNLTSPDFSHLVRQLISTLEIEPYSWRSLEGCTLIIKALR